MAPPFDTGGVKLTVACIFPLTAVTAVGAPGTAAVGITGGAEAADGALIPTAFAAVTVNVYGTLYVSPVTVRGLAGPLAVLAGVPLEVTVYPLIALPFANSGGVKLTVACAFPLTAVTAVGALGTAAVGVTTLETADGTLFPIALVAVTVKV